MSNEREMYLDAEDDAPPTMVNPLTDEPPVDTGYDPGNPWWGFCQEYERQQVVMWEQRRRHWDSLSDGQKEECRRFAQQSMQFIREIKDVTYKMPDAAAETNRFILRAMEKEQLDREARARGEHSPCSLDETGAKQ